MVIWNPWHGCHKVSEGCEHCYMYFLDSKRGLDTSHVFRTENFAMPIQRRRNGQFKLPSGMTLYVRHRLLCRQIMCHIEISQRGLQEGKRTACSVLDYPLHGTRHQPIVA